MMAGMNTFEARNRARTIADRALVLLRQAGDSPDFSFESRDALRGMVVEARGLLADAGYPAEAVWRALHRASIGADTQLGNSDPHYWRDVRDELDQASATLTSLVEPGAGREQDFRVVH